MILMLIMTFLLPQYWARARLHQPGSGLVCPDGLVRDLAANNLRAIDTVTDGNCGLHSFGVAVAADGEHNPRLARSNKFKEFCDAKKKGISSMIAYLRRCLVASMNIIKDSVMWEGMNFKMLALIMSSNTEAFDEYVNRMAHDGEWLDASCLHALGCAFSMDIMIWQQHQDQTLVGISCGNITKQSLGMLSLAMVNDLHYWAVVPVDFPDMPLPETSADDLSSLKRKPLDRHTATDESDDDDIPPVHTITDAPHRMSDAAVDAELALCSCLCT